MTRWSMRLPRSARMRYSTPHMSRPQAHTGALGLVSAATLVASLGCATQPTRACTSTRPPVDPRASLATSTPLVDDAPCAASLAAMGWLDGVTTLHIGVTSDGHFGRWTMHADLSRTEAEQEHAYVGPMTGTFRRRPGEAARVGVRELHVTAAAITALLSSLRDATRVPPARPGVRTLSVGDTSTTTEVLIDAVMHDPTAMRQSRSRHTQFFAEDAQDWPQRWHVLGCPEVLPHDGQHIATDAYRAFAQQLRIDDLREELRAGADGSR